MAASDDELFRELPAGLAEAFDRDRPWDLLGEPLDALLDALPSSDLCAAIGPDVHLIGDRIAIGKGTRILPGAVIEGPISIGEDVLIRPGAYLRGGVWIGNGCVIGASTEIKRAILLDGAKAPHLNYVGDSVLGREVNLGAGTILSNFRFDGAEVKIPSNGERIPSGRRKLGAVLGDEAQTGCSCVLFPGVVVGARTWIAPGVHLAAGFYPGDSRIRTRLETEIRPA
jgi:bifunctional N-acetylglucosamine-1-phosphate-uridyltransferase/glucosamine-1-phosphate-acetyltransferase GlmU-like protein